MSNEDEEWPRLGLRMEMEDANRAHTALVAFRKTLSFAMMDEWEGTQRRAWFRLCQLEKTYRQRYPEE